MKEKSKEITKDELKQAIIIWFEVNNHILRLIRGHHNKVHPVFFVRRRLLRMIHKVIQGYINDARKKTVELGIDLPELHKPDSGVDKIFKKFA